MYINRIFKYISLTKPKITQLIIFCSIISMLLAEKKKIHFKKIILATLGIWLIASSAFIINCIIEKKKDSLMERTKNRPTVKKEINILKAIIFSIILVLSGTLILYNFVNILTMYLTILTFICYSIIYTIFIKPYTSYNIVIGGLTGSMPPILGWVSITNNIFSIKAWILLLIIFFWTPPHFWALAMYYKKDYIKSGIPILPITHGIKYTKINILCYTIILFFVSTIPFFIKMSGIIYITVSVILGLFFIKNALQIYFNYTKSIALKTFKYSIIYLFLIFTTLLIDHYIFI